MSKPVRVAVGVIERSGQIFIAKRAQQQHQGGLWEFPGGKIEPGESTVQALERELHEELGINQLEAEPLIYLEHDYGDKCVALDVYKVTSFSGEPYGAEGQPTKWVSKSDLACYDFPAANRPIVNAICLPQLCAICPQEVDEQNLSDHIKRAFSLGAGSYYLRSTCVTADALESVAALCSELGIFLFVTPQHYKPDLNLNIQVPAGQLESFDRESYQGATWVGASCHDHKELVLAEKRGCDFAFLSPVKVTNTHPEVEPLGLELASVICAQAKLPVYALGGMELNQLKPCLANGFQGLAGIGCFL